MRNQFVLPLGISLALLPGCMDDGRNPELAVLEAQIDNLRAKYTDTLAELDRLTSKSNANLDSAGGLESEDAAVAREAIRALVAGGAKVLPEMRRMAASADSPVVRKRAKDVIGKITGNWGSQVDLIWKRSMQDATNQGKPIMLLHLFGKLDEEFC